MSRSIKNRRTIFGALLGAAATLALGLGVFAGAGGAASTAAPVNTSPPTVTGTPQVGHKLTGDRGVWSGSPTDYNYFWTRCDKTGGSCANISGANATTYTLTTADVGNTLRFKVQATNADGSSSDSSVPTAVIAAAAKVLPVNTSLPTVTGTAQAGQMLTGAKGVWSGSPTDYNYFWTRCDTSGESCANISGANATTYTLTSADVGNTIRFKVEATNADGSTFASSARTAVVTSATKPPPPPAVNHAPTIRILSTRFSGARISVKMRVCDDSYRNLTIIARDSKPGVASFTRRFATLAPPRPCAALTRSWLPGPRFRHGRYTVTLWARDKSGKTSLPAHRTFSR